MRIIGGTARSRLIKTPKGQNTRPTLDRVRENLFNILQNRVRGASVLDLFGGSGALALEAVSRGAAQAFICDRDREAISCIRENVKTLGFDSCVQVFAAEWQQALLQLTARKAKLDLVFLDPPYVMTDLREVTERLLPLLNENAVVVIEHDRGSSPVWQDAYEAYDRRSYGIAGLIFLHVKGAGEE